MNTKPRIKLYNTLTRKKELFRPTKMGRVSLYTCGPTVYNLAHIGNLRTYLFEDALRRTLEQSGFRVKHVMNITDVDDKTIQGAHRENKTLAEFTKTYEVFFKENLVKLNIKNPAVFTKATEYIPDMIALISKLLQRGYAYEQHGSVYFDISKFKKYGALAHVDTQGLKAGTRIDVDEYSKKEVRDFVLWKAKKRGEPSWPAPFGEGRPGWHIECSAMSLTCLGSPIDIHAAGVDLIFPHHENEIAQSEAATGRKFVNYWVHGEHLLVNGKKMSKSLNNFFTLDSIIAKNIDPLAFRYLILTSHYRSKLNFTWISLGASATALAKLRDFVEELNAAAQKPLTQNSPRAASLETYRKRFDAALSNDLNTPVAIAALWDLIHTYRKQPKRFDSKKILILIYAFDTVLGLNLKPTHVSKIPNEIEKLLQERERYREAKNWAKADITREKIEKLGYRIEDTPTNSHIKHI